jgi:ProP effector
MGFEQLASLRDELAQQAAAEKLVKQQKNAERAPGKKTTNKVDPVVLIIGLLQKKFPIAFPINPAPKIPLKIGIHKDILEQADQLNLSEQDVRAALKKWCRGKRYSDCIVVGAARFDLYGNPVGQVTKDEAVQTEKFNAGRSRQDKASSVQQSEALKETA